MTLYRPPQNPDGPPLIDNPFLIRSSGKGTDTTCVSGLMCTHNISPKIAVKRRQHLLLVIVINQVGINRIALKAPDFLYYRVLSFFRESGLAPHPLSAAFLLLCILYYDHHMTNMTGQHINIIYKKTNKQNNESLAFPE